MLRVFHLDITKVNLDVAFVFIYKCFSFFHMYGVSVLFGCLHMFAMVTHVFSSFFWYFCKCFTRTLQVFQLFRTYVVSVLFRCCKSRLGVVH